MSRVAQTQKVSLELIRLAIVALTAEEFAEWFDGVLAHLEEGEQ